MYSTEYTLHSYVHILHKIATKLHINKFSGIGPSSPFDMLSQTDVVRVSIISLLLDL